MHITQAHRRALAATLRVPGLEDPGRERRTSKDRLKAVLHLDGQSCCLRHLLVEDCSDRFDADRLAGLVTERLLAREIPLFVRGEYLVDRKVDASCAKSFHVLPIRRATGDEYRTNDGDGHVFPFAPEAHRPPGERTPAGASDLFAEPLSRDDSLAQ